MLDQILASFTGSSEVGEIAQQLIGSGLSPAKAQDAVVATAEGTKQAVGAGGLPALLQMVGGGGGVMGALGGMLGGEAATGTSALADKVAGFVAQRIGLDPQMAKLVVNLVLPKLLDYAKQHGG